jgi:hypothetical protein
MAAERRFERSMGTRLTWPEIRAHKDYRGRWVALDECRYDARTAQPLEGTVVDVDEDLVSLCNRMREGDNRHCAILFCEEAIEIEPASSRRASVPPRFFPAGRHYTH